ncbi:hypothetical protein K491DRAFT_674982 [Lophiostoma macrostomum CBS 122681]|uniref:Uncharacterized protein n=1 Tax=Lophiostoma macrostomum CBS 122681 TaxID=1314788 RepID=A0A6A6TLL3_9PLEO|nr:hypothetical protein K491DRAFT_674982 [Lophiostoma macrostomum CBS 122681]
MASSAHYDDDPDTSAPLLIIDLPTPAKLVYSGPPLVFLVGQDKTRMEVDKGQFATVSTINMNDIVQPILAQELDVARFSVVQVWLKKGFIVTSYDKRIRGIVNQKHANGETYGSAHPFPELCNAALPTTLENIYGFWRPEAVLKEAIFHENWAILIDVYAFAHQWGIRALRQAIIYKLEQLYEPAEWWFPREEFEHLAAKLPASSPLVKFSLYCFARHHDLDHDKEIEDFLQRLPKEFLVQWLIITSNVNNKRTGYHHDQDRDAYCDLYMPHYNPCLWHEHGEHDKHIAEAHKTQVAHWIERQ